MKIERAAFRLAIGMATVIVAALAMAAANASAVIIREANGHKLGVTLRRGVAPPKASATSSSASHSTATATASTTWNGSIPYNGGPVFHSSTPYLVFWTPSGESIPTSSKNLLQRWLVDNTADSGKSTNLFGVLRQYYDSGGFVDYNQSFSASSNVIVDTQPYPTRDTTNCPDVSSTGAHPYPNCITDLQLGSELARLTQANGLPTDGSASASTFPANAPLYIFVLPNNVNVCFPWDGGVRCGDNYYCSYHSNATNSSNQELIYTLDLTLTDYLTPKNCQPDGNSTVQEPNGDVADLTIGLLSHEYSEALTDPEYNAWTDESSGAESGDACANYGATENPTNRVNPNAWAPTLGGTASAGNLYDELIDGNKYYTQSEWSNGDLTCHLQPASGTMSASFTDTAPVQPGTAVSFNPSASSSRNGYSSVTWNWGDGTSSFTGGSGPATTTHTYASAGTYTVTLTLVDTAGNVATKSQSVVIGTLPTVTTGSSSSVGASTASVAGTVNPNGSSTSYEFDYATAVQYAPGNPPASQYASQSPASPGSVGSGTSVVNESASLTGLQPNTTYHYRIEATNGGGTSYGSDQTFTTSGNSVGAPSGPTSSPQGTWVGSYGGSGYDLAAWSGNRDVVSMPGATVSLLQGGRYVWASSTSDPRALEYPDGSSSEAATYYSATNGQIQAQLSFSSAYSGNLEFYAVDWDHSGRRETITVGTQTANLNSDFSQGAWVSFPISVAANTTLTVTVANTGPSNAVLSGIFLGGGGTPPPPPTPPTTYPSSPQGTWLGTYGGNGYDLAGWNGGNDVVSMPGVTASLQQGNRYVWAANTSDPRALEYPDGNSRTAATYYDSNQIKVQLSFSSTYTGNLELYAVDWDHYARQETITVGTQTANLNGDFSQGAWITFPLNQAANSTLTITVTNTGPSNAVLSGIFLGGGGTPPAPPSPPTTYPSAPQGSWVGTYGTSGYDLAGWNNGSDVASTPGVTLSLLQGNRYVWAANTSDPRALENAAGTSRTAATYYDSNQIQIQLSFSSAYTGNLELYAVDWDHYGRQETITVGTQTANLTQDFSQGAWITFPLNQAANSTLTITITNTSNANAVLSGIFLK